MLDSPFDAFEAFGSPFGRRRRDPFAVAGLQPPLVAAFRDGYFRAGGVPLGFADLFTFARPGPATYVDATGTRRTAADGEPRLGHHVYEGGQWVNKGLLIESEARTQLLHSTDALTTQTESVTAQPYTLHFTGTGSVTLSGAHSATLNGTGDGEQNRVYLTFTPSAGTLTLTVSGAVTDAKLEAGSTPSSYIPNLAGSGTATRAAETLTIQAAKLPYSSTAMSIAMKGIMTYADEDDGAQSIFANWYADSLNYLRQYLTTSGDRLGAVGTIQRGDGAIDLVFEASPGSYTPGINVPFSIASRHGATFINGAADGTALTADETPTALPDLSATDLQLAYDFMGTIESFRMWAADLGDDGIAVASS